MEHKPEIDRIDFCVNHLYNGYPCVLYHYTTIDALYGMLFDKKEIWLGEASFMNDRREVLDYINNLKEACLARINHQNINDLNLFFERVNNTLVDSYPYILSLSMNYDDAAQWERYAANAHGVCIVFDTKLLAKLCLVKGLLLHKVIYSYDPKNHICCNYVVDMIDKHQMPDECCTEDHIISLIINSSPLCKHVSFQSENEVRAVLPFVPQSF